MKQVSVFVSGLYKQAAIQSQEPEIMIQNVFSLTLYTGEIIILFYYKHSCIFD